MPYSAAAIANHFLDLAKAQGKSLTPMKVQKLVYFAHGWNLAINEEPLINEQVEAWKFGPVIRTLYRDLARYGNKPVAEKIHHRDYVTTPDGDVAVVTTPDITDEEAEGDTFTRELLGKIWEVYGGYSAIQLSNLTHEEGSPWDRVNKQYNGNLPKGTDIPTDQIRDYFVAQAAVG